MKSEKEIRALWNRAQKKWNWPSTDFYLGFEQAIKMVLEIEDGNGNPRKT